MTGISDDALKVILETGSNIKKAFITTNSWVNEDKEIISEAIFEVVSHIGGFYRFIYLSVNGEGGKGPDSIFSYRAPVIENKLGDWFIYIGDSDDDKNHEGFAREVGGKLANIDIESKKALREEVIRSGYNELY